MKILAITDLHAEEQALEFLEKLVLKHSPDAVFCCGDMSDFHAEHFARDVKEKCDSLKVRLIAVLGNADERTDEKLLGDSSIEKKRIEFEGFNVVGFGGASNAVGPNSFDDSELYNRIGKFVDGNTVLLVHAPPAGRTVAMTKTGKDIGTKSLVRLIDEKQPLAVICGHAHEREGIEKMGATKIIKVSPLMYGKAAIVELPQAKTEFVST
ncbi:MAG: metallophosphoesterase family protein [Candidatus Micrarchaeota archaeon]